jgi:hypothetical protein
MYVRTFSGGYPYIRDGIIVRSNSLQPIYSYGKNYAKNGIKFAFFVWTTNSDKTSVENMFDSLVKTVDKKQLEQVSSDGSFAYLD